MSRARFATEKQIRINFAVCLKNAVELGLWPPTDQGFDDYTDRALRVLAKSYPQIKPEYIRSAQLSLEGQFDGTNNARRIAELEA